MNVITSSCTFCLSSATKQYLCPLNQTPAFSFYFFFFSPFCWLSRFFFKCMFLKPIFCSFVFIFLIFFMSWIPFIWWSFCHTNSVFVNIVDQFLLLEIPVDSHLVTSLPSVSKNYLEKITCLEESKWKEGIPHNFILFLYLLPWSFGVFTVLNINYSNFFTVIKLGQKMHFNRLWISFDSEPKDKIEANPK